MTRIFVFFLAGLTAFAGEDAWVKVRELKSGTELRIQKRGSTQPLLAQMGDATEENLVVIVKNEQVAIPKEQIDRIDYRPIKPGGRATKESREEVKGTSSSVTSGISIGSKPDFETIYRRTAPVAPKAAAPQK